MVSRPGHGPNGWVVYTQGQQPKETLGGPNPNPNPNPNPTPTLTRTLTLSLTPSTNLTKATLGGRPFGRKPLQLQP